MISKNIDDIEKKPDSNIIIRHIENYWIGINDDASMVDVLFSPSLE